MVRIAFALTLLASILSACPAQAAGKAHPFAGIGLLVIRPFPAERAGSSDTIPVYEDPGIKRVAELKAAALPGLLGGIGISFGNFATAAMDKKGEWVKIAYDDADREGWIRMKSFWEFIPWSDYLKGRQAVFLPGLRETDYKMRAECSYSSPPLADLSPHGDFRVMEVDGDWMMVQNGRFSGCIRWKDGDGRLMISPGETGP